MPVAIRWRRKPVNNPGDFSMLDRKEIVLAESARDSVNRHTFRQAQKVQFDNIASITNAFPVVGEATLSRNDLIESIALI